MIDGGWPTHLTSGIRNTWSELRKNGRKRVRAGETASLLRGGGERSNSNPSECSKSKKVRFLLFLTTPDKRFIINTYRPGIRALSLTTEGQNQHYNHLLHSHHYHPVTMTIMQSHLVSLSSSDKRCNCFHYEMLICVTSATPPVFCSILFSHPSNPDNKFSLMNLNKRSFSLSFWCSWFRPLFTHFCYSLINIQDDLSNIY